MFAKSINLANETVGNENEVTDNSVTIIFSPFLHCSSLLPGLFLLVSSHDTFPYMSYDNTDITTESPGMRTVQENIPIDYKLNYEGVAYGLVEYINYLGLSVDIFPLGTTSRFIGKQINSYMLDNSINVIPTLVNTTINSSLILIDRNLDLVSPTLHSDNLLDKLIHILPTTDNLNDILIGLNNATTLNNSNSTIMMNTPINNNNNNNNNDSNYQDYKSVFGTIAQPEETIVNYIIYLLSCKKEKEALNEIIKKLVEIASKEKLEFQLPKSVNSIKQLNYMFSLFYSDSTVYIKYSPLLSILSAILHVYSNSNSNNKYWDELVGIEKTMLITIDDKNESLLKKIIEISSNAIPGTETTTFTIEQIVTLAIFSYSLLGTNFNKKEEK